MLNLSSFHEQLQQHESVEASGRVLRVIGSSIIASGPAESVGSICKIICRDGEMMAIVSAFREGEIILQGLESVRGVRPGDKVIHQGDDFQIQVGPQLVGRVIDALGNPLDGKGPIGGRARRGMHSEPPAALGRPPIKEILETGIRSIDTCYTIGKGQRLGIFAGSGVGKSTLMGELAKQAQADVTVIALIGERGREVGEFVQEILGEEGLAKSVVIVSTSDRPAVERVCAAETAHAVAEHFRDTGCNVLLMLDSLTRYCHAYREIGLSNGEPPAMRGYPPSVFAHLPKLLERAGTNKNGSITALYTVLVDGDDENDPVADNARAILDGHLFLSRNMAGRGIYPAIDPLLSVSRLLDALASKDELLLAREARGLWAEYERVRDLVEVGAYQSGSDPRADKAIGLYAQLLAFFQQERDEHFSREDSLQALSALLQMTMLAEQTSVPVQDQQQAVEQAESGQQSQASDSGAAA